MQIQELFPYMIVNDAKKAIEFYKQAFDAKEKFRLCEPSGRVGHVELEFGKTTVMLADEFPELGFRGPTAYGGTTVTIHIHVDNADEVIARAVAAGATVVREPKDQFYGERSGSVRDPFGHMWNIGHHIEDLTPEEMQNRYDKVAGGT